MSPSYSHWVCVRTGTVPPSYRPVKRSGLPLSPFVYPGKDGRTGPFRNIQDALIQCSFLNDSLIGLESPDRDGIGEGQ